jgi:PPOX class probable F420-dependent enzyme
MTPEADQYLREHDLGTLATGRRDGSPQLALVYYHSDGQDIVISTRLDRPQWINSRRQPRVALLVQDGRKYVLVYGSAEHVTTDPARLNATRRIAFFRNLHPHDIDDDAALTAQLDADQRGILRIVPDKVIKHD